MNAILYQLDFASGKRYIGATVATLGDRLCKHVYDAKSRGGAYAVAQAFIDHPNPEAKVLVVGGEEYIRALETKAIHAFDTQVPNGYNTTVGGSGFRANHTELSRLKMSKARKGRKLPDGVGDKMSASRQRKVSSDNLVGVWFDKALGKWRARVTVKRKAIYLGSYADVNDAIAARRAGEEKYYAG